MFSYVYAFPFLFVLKRITVFIEPYWGSPRAGPPKDVPPCGFFDELCPKDYTSK